MHKVIADKNGGKKVALTEKEVAQLEIDALQELKEKALKEQEVLSRNSAVDSLVSNLSEKDRIVIKNILGV
jgi:hypothetical protein